MQRRADMLLNGYSRIVMARWLLRVIIFYSLHHLLVRAPLVPDTVRPISDAGQRIENIGTSRPVEPSTGPSSRTANWESTRTDTVFRRKCGQFRRSLQGLRGDDGDDEEEIDIDRGNIFEDSFDKTISFRMRRWKKKWAITFIGEPGYGSGVNREWYTELIRSTADMDVQLFISSDGDRDAYTINPNKSANAETLQRFTFIGRVIAKAVFSGQLLPMYFTRSMYKHILGKQVDCTDLAIEDPQYYRSLEFIRDNDVGQIKNVFGRSLKWSVEVVVGGKEVVRDLIPGGGLIPVTNGQRKNYVKRVCKMKLHGVIKKQLDAFLTGFYDIIPKTVLSIFNEHELELVISGPPVIDVDDWQANTVYEGYTAQSPIIKWFWETLRSFNQEQLSQFLQYVTGSSKPPLRGFAYLDGKAQGFRKFVIKQGDVLKAVVCNYALILPSGFESKEHMEEVLLNIIGTSSHGFDLT